jgi:hypothetical protein
MFVPADHLMAVLAPRRAVFLLGAGASKDAGLPLTEEFFPRMEEAFAGAAAAAPSADEVALVAKERQLFQLVRELMRRSEVPFHDPDNFEQVAETVATLRLRTSDSLFPFVSSWAHELAEFDDYHTGPGTPKKLFADLPHPFDLSMRIAAAAGAFCVSAGVVYDRLYNRIVLSVREWLRKDYAASDLDYLEELANLARGSDVFTLNYDLAVEEAYARASDCSAR